MLMWFSFYNSYTHPESMLDFIKHFSEFKMILWFILLHSVKMVYNIDGFTYCEYLRLFKDESNLIIMYNPFIVLLI